MQGRMTPRRAGRSGGGWIAAALLGGIALQLQQPALWPPQAYAAAALFGLTALALALRGVAAGSTPHWAAVALAVALLAFAGTGWRAGQRLADGLDAALQGQDLQVTGVVSQMPRESETGTRFVFDVESAERQGRPVRLPARLALGWMRGWDREGPELSATPDAAAPRLRAGQRWRLTLRLKQAHGALNPHGFDLELWLFERGIRASGYVRTAADSSHLKLADGQGFVVERARQAVREAIAAQVPDAATAGVLAALAVGDQAAIERADWDLFRATGVAHLMSISGLHVTMFAWGAGGLIGWCWRRGGRIVLRLPAPHAARWGGLACAAAYALMAGWGVPAQRTVWMIATVVVLRSLGRRWPLPAVLAAAAVVVAVVDPWALLQAGFWLSFAAVALLVASEPVAGGAAPLPAGRRAQAAATLRGALRTQAVASVSLAPLSLVFFQQISLVGFAANLLAIPLVTLVVTPLALLGVLLPPLWSLAAAAVQALNGVLAWMAAAPLALWTAAVAPPWATAAGLLGGALAVLPLPWRWRLAGVALLLPLLAPPVERPAPGRFELVAADVGQGTAVLLRTARHLLVYDTGPRYSAEADAGERVLLPLLRARGETRVHHLVLSHRDSDHVGGAASLLAALPVERISHSLAAAYPLRAATMPQQRCAAGQRWDWDGVHFEVLHPPPGADAGSARPNTLSCVVRVQGATASVLLTGDIESAQERQLLAAGAALRSDVMLVPHHGSRTSSSAPFLDAVAPRLAIVQAAYRSRFGHPAPDVTARYAARGIDLYRSDRCGALTLPAGYPGEAPRCERQAARRYWHHAGTVRAAGPVEWPGNCKPQGNAAQEFEKCPSTSR